MGSSMNNKSRECPRANVNEDDCNGQWKDVVLRLVPCRMLQFKSGKQQPSATQKGNLTATCQTAEVGNQVAGRSRTCHAITFRLAR